jgi:hypothetical protein
VGGTPLTPASYDIEFTAVQPGAPKAPVVKPSNGAHVAGTVHDDDLTRASNNLLTGVVKDSASGVELVRCAVGAGGQFDCALPNLAHGTEITVWVEDDAALASPEVALTVDAVGPIAVKPRPTDGVNLEGRGEEAGNAVRVVGPGGGELCSTSVNSGVNWACPLSPAVHTGDMITITETDGAGNTTSITWRVGVPKVTVAPTTAAPGDALAVSGVNFQPGETVAAVMHSDPVSIGQMVADSQGSVSLPWVVPQLAGTHQVVLTGSVSGAYSTGLEIRVKGSDDGGGNGNGNDRDELGTTGAQSSIGWVGSALGLILCGVLLVAAAHRRRRQDTA